MSAFVEVNVTGKVVTQCVKHVFAAMQLLSLRKVMSSAGERSGLVGVFSKRFGGSVPSLLDVVDIFVCTVSAMHSLNSSSVMLEWSIFGDFGSSLTGATQAICGLDCAFYTVNRLTSVSTCLFKDNEPFCAVGTASDDSFARLMHLQKLLLTAFRVVHSKTLSKNIQLYDKYD